MSKRIVAIALVLLGAGLLGGFVAVAAVLCLGLAWCLFVASGTDPEFPTRPSKARLRVWTSPASYIDGVDLVMRITNEQKSRVTVAPKTAGGNDAPIDGAVAFTSSDESVAVIEAIDDTSCYVRAVGPGAAQVTAVFDADLGEGVRQLTASGVLEVVAAEAETAEIVFGEAEQQ